MRKLILFISLFIGPFSALGEPIHVLLLGDSLGFMPTPAHPELPSLVHDLLAERGIDVQIDYVLHGGHTLEMHLDEGEFAQKLSERKYDFVIIQPYSIEALHLPACFATNVHDAPKGYESFLASGKILASMIHEKDPNASVLLFEPWTYDDSHDWLQANFVCRNLSADDSRTWYGGSLEAYRSMLHQGYVDLAKATGAEILRIGDLWWTVRTDDNPEVSVHALYQDDHFHPTYLGSYLASVAVATRLGGIQPQKFAFHPPEISESQAQYLRQVVQRRETPLSARSE